MHTKVPAAIRAAPPTRRLNATVLLDFLLSGLGFYCLVPVLPSVIHDRTSTDGALLTGAALFTFTAAYKGGSLFCGHLLQRLPVRTTMTSGLLLAGVGFFVLRGMVHPLGVLVCLVLAGFGISVNNISARVLVAVSLSASAARNAAFAYIQVAINVAAAVGPVAANLLLGSRPQALLPVIAGIFLLTAILTFWLTPLGVRADDGATRKPLGMRLIVDMVRDPKVRTVSLLTLTGSIMYGQFFSAFAIHVTHVTDSPTLRGAFYTANAVLIVGGQVLVTRLTNRALGRGSPPWRILCLGIATFALSFLLLAIPSMPVLITFLAVGVFAAAEMVFSPMASTAYAQLGDDRPMVEVFNFRQVSATIGESLGGFAGGALFTAMTAHHMSRTYWAATACVGLAAIAPYLLRKGSGRTA
ncbi:MFS transporter [Streptomyces sp. NBC_01231]|nr:MFS transporter [Streptomyces sp. NBC_01231]